MFLHSAKSLTSSDPGYKDRRYSPKSFEDLATSVALHHCSLRDAH
jgi:hypothetical protein